MPAVMNKRKVLSIKEQVNVIKQTQNGKKKADVCQEFGLINSDPKDLEKQTKLLMCLNGTDHK